jgi:hypothetical protein
MAIKTLNESDYILLHTSTTISYLDSAHISYTVIKTYPGSDFIKINR